MKREQSLIRPQDPTWWFGLITLFLLGIFALFGFEGDAFNIWTLIHFGWGVIFGIFAIPVRIAVFVIIAWEPLEQLYLVPMGICWPPEPLIDSITDIAIGLFGYLLSRYIIGRH